MPSSMKCAYTDPAKPNIVDIHSEASTAETPQLTCVMLVMQWLLLLLFYKYLLVSPSSRGQEVVENKRQITTNQTTNHVSQCLKQESVYKKKYYS